MNIWLQALGIFVVIGAPIAGVLLWIKAFNGPDGERLQKFRMQGPFVPLSPEEVRDDERSRSDHRSAGEHDGSCPTCRSTSVVEGHLLSSGTDEGPVTRFFPKRLRFFTFRRSVPLAHDHAVRACLACGHVWTQTSPSELRQLLAASDDAKSQELLARVRDEPDEASKLRF